MAKKQTKADKDFIAKISTLSISTKSSGHEHSPTCGCGKPLHKVGQVSGEVCGKQVTGDVYVHDAPQDTPEGAKLKGMMKRVREKKRARAR